MQKKILQLAWPNILSNITIPLLGLVDTALMGHLDSLDYLGAIALGSMIFNIIYWSLGFLRMGTVGFTARAFGANDSREASLIISRGLLLSFALGLAAIALSPLLIKAGIGLTQSGPGVKTYAAQYVQIRIWAAPASLMIMVFSGWFLGMQKAVYPMLIAITGNVANIIMSFFFVYVMDLKSNGAALGTLLAQYLALALSFYLFRKSFKTYFQKWSWRELLHLSEMKEFFTVNADIFIRTLGILFVISFFTIQSANISDSTLAVNSVLFQFFLFYSFMLDGFANAAEAMTGEYLGSRNRQKLVKTIRLSLLFGLIFSLIFSLSYATANEYILKLLTDNTLIINEAKSLMLWVVLMPLISFPAFIFDGIFIGATASGALRNGMLVSVLLFFVPVYYYSPLPLSAKLWLAFLSFMAGRGITLALALKGSVLNNKALR